MRRLSVGRLLAAVVAMTGTASPGAAQPCLNPIVCENQLPGHPKTDWQIDAPGPVPNDISDVDESLEGFTDRMSYLPGETVNFKVSTDAASCRIEVYFSGTR
jgi:hypothetical protein